MKEIKINNNQETIYTFITPTKMPVYMWVNNTKTNVHITLNVKYGSSGTKFTCNNVEYSVPTGTAHYLEHLKFHLKDDDASNMFYDLGCDSNAYTSLNETSYEVYANENIYEATKLLLNFVFDNYFTKKLVDNERAIILEEANANKDDPDYEFYQAVIKNYLVSSNHRNPVIGYEKDIKSITIDDISLVHNFFYRPENMFMVIAGSFDPVKMKEIICENEKDRNFKDLGTIKIDIPKEPKKMQEKYIEVVNKNCVNKSGKYIVKCVQKDFGKYSKSEILVALRSIIGANFNSSSDFYEEIIQNNIATRFASNVSYDDGVYGIGFSFTSEEPEKVFEMITDKLKHIEFTKEDLNRVIKSQKTSSIIRYDNIYNVSSYLIASIIDDNKISDERMNTLNKLTIKKAMDIYSKVDLNNYMTAILKNKK